MYTRNRIGPSTVPCGTLEVTGTDVEVSPSSTTAWVLFLRKSAERSQNTILLASTQAVYKSPHSTVWRAELARAFEHQHLTGEHLPVGSLRA